MGQGAAQPRSVCIDPHDAHVSPNACVSSAVCAVQRRCDWQFRFLFALRLVRVDHVPLCAGWHLLALIDRQGWYFCFRTDPFWCDLSLCDLNPMPHCLCCSIELLSFLHSRSFVFVCVFFFFFPFFFFTFLLCSRALVTLFSCLGSYGASFASFLTRFCRSGRFAICCCTRVDVLFALGGSAHRRFYCTVPAKYVLSSDWFVLFLISSAFFFFLLFQGEFQRALAEYGSEVSCSSSTNVLSLA